MDPRREDAAAAVRAATTLGADIVIDAAGTLLPEALAMVRRRGRVILFGMNLHSDRTVNQYAITRHEISIMGSFIQTREFPKAVRILESGILPVEQLATHYLRLPDVGQGFEALRSGEAIKVVVEP
jgi:threonine dehydrogenase-like Zn-dependent dehydrogenase